MANMFLWTTIHHVHNQSLLLECQATLILPWSLFFYQMKCLDCKFLKMANGWKSILFPTPLWSISVTKCRWINCFFFFFCQKSLYPLISFSILVYQTFFFPHSFLHQVLSNDRYKSVLHRAVVNCDKERISIATFYYPSLDATMGHAKELIDDDNPAAYRNHSFSEFYEKFWNRGLATECCLLDLFKSSVV